MEMRYGPHKWAIDQATGSGQCNGILARVTVIGVTRAASRHDCYTVIVACVLAWTLIERNVFKIYTDSQ